MHNRGVSKSKGSRENEEQLSGRKEGRQKQISFVRVFISKINKGNFLTWHMKRMTGVV